MVVAVLVNAGVTVVAVTVIPVLVVVLNDIIALKQLRINLPPLMCYPIPNVHLLIQQTSHVVVVAAGVAHFADQTLSL